MLITKVIPEQREGGTPRRGQDGKVGNSPTGRYAEGTQRRGEKLFFDRTSTSMAKKEHG